MLFLSRAQPAMGKDTNGQPTLTLLCVDRIGQHAAEPWKLVWKGPAAVDFWRGHAGQLVAGTPLAVIAESMRTHSFGRMTEVTAKVVSLALVPGAQKVSP